MTKADGYWPNPELDGRFSIDGNAMNLPGRIALVLIEKWGTVAGHIRDKEDSSGRAVLDVMPVADVVERAFSMAELAVRELERREWIRHVDKTPEEYGEALGRIEKARYQRVFPTVR
jgi:hypothetical protein